MGRYANRIAGAKFSLDGTVYSLPANNAPGGLPCCLHGGKNGFNKKVWSGTVVAGGVLLRLRSADGEEGFPGAVDVSVLYEVLPANTLRITYGATTNRPTPLNLTQHSYFNLAGGTGDILSHSLKLGATHYTPFNKGLIPTGEIAPVAGTPLDFTTPHRIGERINSAHPQMRLAGGYDHNWVLTSTAGNAAGSTAGSAGTLRFAAELHDSQSGRTMRVFTTEPGIQIYTGNGLAGVCGKNKQTYSKHAGIALETQHFPDSPNQPAFPNTILRPSERFHSVTELRFF
jgi:aldose 1-epimerase